MKNDLHQTFGEIFRNDNTAFRRQLMDIQYIRADRKKSEDWVSSLRFLDISKVPFLPKERDEQERQHAVAEELDLLYARSAPSCEIPVTERKDDTGEIPYIAVSWKWTGRHYESPYQGQTLPHFRYQIRRPGKALRQSKFPDLYMDRVIQFAQIMNIERIWIDTECIYQEPGDDPNDKALGVQIMDVVYGDSTFSIGLLTTTLDHQWEIDTLAKLLSRSLFVEPEDTLSPTLRPDVDKMEVQMVILRVLSDPRWSRGWIFQEDHLASDRMILLIAIGEGLRKSYYQVHYDFGKLTGELQVNLKAFKQAVTMFCLACPESRGRWPNTEFLAKAKQYNIWNKKIYGLGSAQLAGNEVPLWDSPPREDGFFSRIDPVDDYSNLSFYPTTTNSVLDDICSRSLQNEEDRIAILANALRYPKRLNVSSGSPLIKPGEYSLSAALLALLLMNGEILMNAPLGQCDDVPTEKTVMQHTLQSYLKSCEYRYNPPNTAFQQSFIDHCRFKPSIITPRGLETKGFLFNLLPHKQPHGRIVYPDLLRLTAADRRALAQTERSKGWFCHRLDNIGHKALEMIIEKLQGVWPNGRLARFLQRYVSLDREPPRTADKAPATKYILEMISALYQALLDNRELRLARLASAPADAEPVAIFIRPELDGWRADDQTIPPTIFTSWDSGRNAYDKERLASLEVAIFDGRDMKREWDADTCSLLSFGWVNGVWDVRGEPMNTYTFPSAGITPYPGSGSRKRKRGGP